MGTGTTMDTVMDTITGSAATGTDAPGTTLLKLMWLASPPRPLGGFSDWQGLAAAGEAGLGRDEASAGTWLEDQLRLALGRAELPLVAQAFEAWRAGELPRAAALNEWLLTTRESAEL